MSPLSTGEQFKVHHVTAYNFATESDNKIHSDEMAARYGFKGGLVPGVGVYGYMTIPIVGATSACSRSTRKPYWVAGLRARSWA